MWLVLTAVEITVLVLALVHVRGTVREIVRDHVVPAHTTAVMDAPVGVTVVATQVVMEAARVIVMVNAPHVTDVPTAAVATERVASDVIHRAMQAHMQVYKKNPH